MKISSLRIPIPLREKYAQLGIEELYPPQEKCVEAGLFERKNLLVSIPTASGKTLVAEMAMQKEIADGGKCLYIVPLKALASEKYEEFSGKGVTVGVATGDPDQRDEYLGRYDIIVATSEKTDSLLRNRSEWLKRVSLLVVDEIHLIGDESRGATLEMVIATLRYQNPTMQIIGLSATMGNPEELAEWLNATLITSEWRPVDLREGVYFNGAIHFHGSERVVPTPKKEEEDLNLLLDTVEEGGQSLVFVSSRRSAEAYAKRAAATLKKSSPELDSYSEIIAKADTTPSGKVLAASVKRGAAFHHAGLPRAARQAVEEGFKKGHILVISSTPTLAAGINLPARRVIIRDYQRFESGIGMHPIPVMEYRQMAGRAGRPRLDPYGEAVLIAKDKTQVDSLFEEFIDAPAENISSQCQKENELRNHLLALITSGFAKNREELFGFMEKSFYASQKKVHRRLDRNIEKTVEYLKKADMIEVSEENFSGTLFGVLASRLYLDPETASMIKTAVTDREEFSAFGVLHLLCMTPDMFRFYLKSSDEEVVNKTLCDREEEFWCEDLCEEFYAAVKTALIAEEWCNEVPEDIICENYGVGAGDIYAVIENLKWLMHATGRITDEFSPKFSEDVKSLETRVANGVKEELLPLISLKGIGRVRARRLFDRGIKTPEDLLEAETKDVVAVLGTTLAKKILEEAQKKIGRPAKNISKIKEENFSTEKTSEKKQKTLFDFGE